MIDIYVPEFVLWVDFSEKKDIEGETWDVRWDERHEMWDETWDVRWDKRHEMWDEIR